MPVPDPVMHVTCAIADTYRGRSKLPRAVTHDLVGFSSPMVRRLMNNLCAFDGCNFLEVGTYRGTTAISASYGNKGRFMAIDSFVEFNDKRTGQAECEAILARHQEAAPVELIVRDAWDVPPERVGPVDVLFYDGDHSVLATKHGVEHFAYATAGTFILVLDDWNLASVRDGLDAVQPDRPWYQLARWELFTAEIARHEGGYYEDPKGWWNGIYVGIYTDRSCGPLPPRDPALYVHPTPILDEDLAERIASRSRGMT